MPKSRGNGEGSVHKMPNGKWQAQIMVGYKDDGTTRNIATVTRDTKKEAVAAAKALKTKPKNYNPKTLLADWADKWYKDLRRKVRVTGENADEINERDNRTLEESTYDGYQYTLRHIKNAFPKDQLGFTSTMRIEEGIAGLMNPVYKRTEDGGYEKDEKGNKIIEKYVRFDFGVYQKVRSMLCQIYNRAEVRGIITHDQNPMYLMEELRDSRRDIEKKDAYETHEVQEILDYVAKVDESKDDGWRKWAYSLAVGVVAGYRSQEAVPLQAVDIEPDGSAICVNKASKRGLKGRSYKGDPKSRAGNRFIELPETVWPYAKWLRDHAENGYIYYSVSMARKSARNGRKGNDFICWIHPSTYGVNICKVLDEIEGVRKLKPHEIQRHTLITLSNEAGIDLRVAMDQSGHSDEKVFKGYDHVHRDAKKRAAAKINDVLKGKSQEQS